MATTMHPSQLEALRRFAAWSDAREARKPRKRDRRTWKDVLMHDYWLRAAIWSGETGNDRNVGGILHGIRNQYGPSWLEGVSLD